MGYGVELSSKTSKKSKPRSREPRGPRGVDRNDILEAAFTLLAREGEAGFSVRKVGAGAGVDPMTVLHHFQSREELLRQIADRALETVELPIPTDDWKHDLRTVANGYRDLAHRYPRLFHLHFRFNATGPADHASSEVVYRAMRRTGLPDAAGAGLGLAFYAFVLGFALAEIEGLLLPLNDMEEAEMLALDPLGYPATRAFIPAFKKLDADAAFDAAVSAFIEGVAVRAKAKR
ncbi:MAG: TetR/AcrR family transcriptional regulator [Hyphomicrobium sp.]|jgi:AcrR family transcriptional regulator|nr:TetR/AcrR family transcriptional regulator [Hyphomicrobium sp.]